MQRELTINAAAFKAQCLGLMDQLAARKLTQITVTKRGKPVSVLSPPPAEEPRPSIIASRPKPPLSDMELDELDIEATGLLADAYGDFRASKLEARLLRHR